LTEPDAELIAQGRWHLFQGRCGCSNRTRIH
jgi:hypothetical protein